MASITTWVCPLFTCSFHQTVAVAIFNSFTHLPLAGASEVVARCLLYHTKMPVYGFMDLVSQPLRPHNSWWGPYQFQASPTEKILRRKDPERCSQQCNPPNARWIQESSLLEDHLVVPTNTMDALDSWPTLKEYLLFLLLSSGLASNFISWLHKFFPTSILLWPKLVASC